MNPSHWIFLSFKCDQLPCFPGPLSVLAPNPLIWGNPFILSNLGQSFLLIHCSRTAVHLIRVTIIEKLVSSGAAEKILARFTTRPHRLVSVCGRTHVLISLSLDFVSCKSENKKTFFAQLGGLNEMTHGKVPGTEKMVTLFFFFWLCLIKMFLLENVFSSLK